MRGKRRLAVMCVLFGLGQVGAARAGVVNEVFRCLGLGWSDGYHAQNPCCSCSCWAHPLADCPRTLAPPIAPATRRNHEFRQPVSPAPTPAALGPPSAQLGGKIRAAARPVQGQRARAGAPPAVPVLKLDPTRVSSAPPAGLEAWHELQRRRSQCRPGDTPYLPLRPR